MVPSTQFLSDDIVEQLHLERTLIFNRPHCNAIFFVWPLANLLDNRPPTSFVLLQRPFIEFGQPPSSAHLRLLPHKRSFRKDAVGVDLAMELPWGRHFGSRPPTYYPPAGTQELPTGITQLPATHMRVGNPYPLPAKKWVMGYPLLENARATLTN